MPEQTPYTYDTLTLAGAKRLARTITDYWTNRGYRGISTWIEPITIPLKKTEGTERIYAVRTNCINGVPPRVPAASAAARGDFRVAAE